MITTFFSNASTVTTKYVNIKLTCDSEQSPTSGELMKYITHAGPGTMAVMFIPLGLFTVIMILFIDGVLFQYKHSIHWRRTAYTAWVLGIFPILASLCLLGLFIPRSSAITSFAVSFYFAFSLKKFFNLTLLYYGGKRKMEEALKADKVVSSNPFPCCFVCCCCNQPMSVARINRLQASVYQVIFVYPVGFFIQLLLVSDEAEKRSQAGQLALTIIGLIIQASALLCLYGYIIIGRSSRYALQQFHIRGKTLVVQLALACNTLQSFILNTIEAFHELPCGFPYPDHQKSYLLHSYLFFYELFVLSLGAWYFFRHSEENCEVIIRTRNAALTSISETATSIKLSISENSNHEYEDVSSVVHYNRL